MIQTRILIALAAIVLMLPITTAIKPAYSVGQDIPVTDEFLITAGPPIGRTLSYVEIFKASFDGDTTRDWYLVKILHTSEPGAQLVSQFTNYDSRWRNDYLDTYFLMDSPSSGLITETDPVSNSSDPAYVTISAGTGSSQSFGLSYSFPVPSVTVANLSTGNDWAQWKFDIQSSGFLGGVGYTAQPGLGVRVNENNPMSGNYLLYSCFSDNFHILPGTCVNQPNHESMTAWRPGDAYDEASVTVDTRTMNSGQLNMWTGASMPGYTYSTFAPYTIRGGVGTTYTLSPQDYNPWLFDHWNNGNTARDRQITANSAVTATAYFRNGPPLGTQQLTIQSQVNGGGSLTGMYTIITQAGVTQATGFTPMTFSANTGQNYVVSVGDYGTYYFDHWDGGSTTRERTVNLSGAQTITAYYRTTPNPPPSGPTLTINAQTTGGNVLSMYTTVTKNGVTVATGFTPMQVAMTSGTYVVTPQDYNPHYFDRWDNGSTTRARSVSGSSSVTVTAYYDSTP